MKRFYIADKETGTVIDEFLTMEEAQEGLKEYEEEDKQDGNYTQDFYEIVEK